MPTRLIIASRNKNSSAFESVRDRPLYVYHYHLMRFRDDSLTSLHMGGFQQYIMEGCSRALQGNSEMCCLQRQFNMDMPF